jgi:hypothetical protein
MTLKDLGIKKGEKADQACIHYGKSQMISVKRCDGANAVLLVAKVQTLFEEYIEGPVFVDGFASEVAIWNKAIKAAARIAGRDIGSTETVERIKALKK